MANRIDKRERMYDDEYAKFLGGLVNMLKVEPGSGHTYAIITQAPFRRPEFIGYHQGDTTEMSEYAAEHEAYLTVAPIDPTKSTAPNGKTLQEAIHDGKRAVDEE